MIAQAKFKRRTFHKPKVILNLVSGHNIKVKTLDSNKLLGVYMEEGESSW